MIAVVNLLIGLLVGFCGVAGFLLPMFYSGISMNVVKSLALSFPAFIVSGVLGAINYKKAGNLDIQFGMKLSAGSLVGATLGVRMNLVIPEDKAKMLLYLVVLLSGISILLRKEKEESGKKRMSYITEHMGITVFLGGVTGFICALSGAGGPVLIMPLLVVFGMPIRTAVGTALFNSIFIGISATVGYLVQCKIETIFCTLMTALFFHGVGVYLGSKYAVNVNQLLLKRGVAVFSIMTAVYKLMG